MFMIYECTNPSAFDRDKRRDPLQTFRNTANAWSGIEVQKPILPARRVRAPQRAPWRRDVNARADAVAERGNVRQLANQLRASRCKGAAGSAIRCSKFGLTNRADLLSPGLDCTHSVRRMPANYSSSQSIDSSNPRNCGLSAESTGSHSPTGSRFHHALSPRGANR